MVPDHDPHPPFIRIPDWHRDGHSQWVSARSVCSICRRPVKLTFGDVLEKDEKARWVHVETTWEHDDERGDRREP